MLVTLLGIVILVSPQLENVIISMLVTLFGIVILVRFTQSLNAPPPMLVTLFGIVILVRFTQFWYLKLIVYQIVVI